MGQKSNIITLKNSQIRFSSLEHGTSETALLHTFLQQLHRLFILSPGVLKIKGQSSVYLLNTVFQKVGTKFYLSLELFFRTKQLARYRLKLKTPHTISFNKTKFLLLFLKLNFSTSTLISSVKVSNSCLLVNRKESRFLLIAYYKCLKRYAGPLFPRRLSTFFDLLKLTVLLFRGQLKVAFFIRLLADIFSILQKKKHTKYLQFLKLVFSKLVYARLKAKSSIAGIKFILWGKLKGKTRGSTTSIIVGQIPIQSVTSSVEYSKCHSYTVYGVFGFKLWAFGSSTRYIKKTV